MSGPSLQYSTLGLVVSIRCADAQLRGRIDELYAACRVPSREGAGLDLDIEPTGVEGIYELRADGESIVRTGDQDVLLEWLAWKVNRMALEVVRSELVLHAGAVQRDDHALLVTGTSGSGKSTLAAALTLAGMAYMGDDTVVVDGESGRIRSNPKPIALDESARAALAAAYPGRAEIMSARGLVAPGAIGATVAVEQAVTPALIVWAAFRPGARASISPLLPARAAELVAEQSFNFRALGSAGLYAAASLARRCPFFIVEFGDLAAAVAVISDAFADATTGHDPAAVPDAPGPNVGHLHVELLGPRALIWNERSRDLHHLNESATAIWMASRESQAPREIAARVGPPGSGGDAAFADRLAEDVARCLDELRNLDLLPGDSE